MKDMEVGGSEVQHYPRLHSKFDANLGYKRLSEEIRKRKKKRKGRGEKREKEGTNEQRNMSMK